MLEDKSSLEETGCSVTERVEIFIIPFCLYSPSYLPFQSVLCPPVSHPLGQPDPLQLSRGFLKVPNASLVKASVSHLPLGLLIPCLDLPSSPSPTPLPLSAVCKEEKGDVCNRTLIPGRILCGRKLSGGAVGRERELWLDSRPVWCIGQALPGSALTSLSTNGTLKCVRAFDNLWLVVLYP